MEPLTDAEIEKLRTLLPHLGNIREFGVYHELMPHNAKASVQDGHVHDYIQSKRVAETLPTEGQGLRFDATQDQWEPGSVVGDHAFYISLGEHPEGKFFP